MRLHLPKTLLAAVLAACAALPTWGEDSGTAVDTTTYTVTVAGTTKTFNSLETGSALPTNTPDAFWVSGGRVTVNSTSQTTLNGIDTVILANGSYTTSTAPEESTSVTSHQLFLDGYASGADINITSSLIVGSVAQGADEQAAIRFGADGANAVKVSGDINVADNSKFVAGGTRAVISGGITGAGKTLTLSNFNTAGSYTMRGADGKSIELGGLTISGDTSVTLNYETATIGTLTLNSTATNAFTLSGGTTTVSTVSGSGSILLNGGTLAVSDTGDFSISGVKFAGGVLDVSSVTGTLTVGGTWTGDFVEKSVKVINANNATIAGSLATSLNPSRLLNYMYKAGNADAGESASSVYRVRREFITATATVDSTQKNRIVIGSVTGADGSTEFSNVALSDLLAGDKVTINGLTGWIGQNGANTILADLKFTGENHINNGSSDNNWITYSGAITGDGTLSYEWATKAYTYNFNGDLSGFTGTISDTTTLNVTIGGTPATEAAKKVNATIDIAGALTVNRDATFTNTVQAGGNIKVTSGVFRVEKSASTNAQLDLSNGDTSTGCVEIASGASLTVGTNIWGTSNDTFASKILLEKDANLVWNGFTITGKTAKDGVETGLKFGANNVMLYSNNSTHSVTNSIITYTGTDEKTLSWQLVDTDLNVESESGTVNLAGNSIGGNLTINAGTVKTSANSNKGVVGAHTVTINAGGTLEALGVDTFGWEDGQKCIQIVMGGTADALAQLKLNSGNLWQTTLGTDVLLKGYSSIGGNSAFKTAGGKITATGTNNVISASMCVMDDVEVEVTGKGDKLQIDNIQYFHNFDNGKESSGTVSVTGEGALSVGAVTRSALKNTGSGSVEVTGAVSDSTISNTGSGSVTLRGTADSTTKLISSGSKGSLTAQGVSSLAEVKAENGGSVALIAAADTSVSVADLTIGTNGQAQAYTSEIALGTVIADKVNIGESGAKFQGNLDITGGLTVQVGSNGQTGGLNMAAAFTSTATGTLTLGSATGTGLELNLSYIPVMTTGDTLTLFSGVGSVLYYEIISAETGGTESAAVTLSDPAPITLTADAVDASKVFNNVDSGFFTVKFVGNNVILTASSNVPEPTTATLSLLALMGLAARRRRRKA